MEILATVLPIVIDILLVVLLTVGIILIIKCIYLLDKAKSVLLNVEEKVNSLNALFEAVNIVNSRIALVSEKVITFVSEKIIGFFQKKQKNDEEEELESILEKERKDK